jgi:acyl-CoA reductase-like NAD-dependent aldehyde dehydrogenase
MEGTSMTDRVTVHRTYKLAIGGAFPRSESGRTYEVLAADGTFLANAAQASRKDVRDAVVAARGAQPGWAGATAFNRGQVLHRIAELLDARRSQFIDEIAALTGDTDAAVTEVDDAVDRWIWYAGWTDKFTQVAGSVNPVAGPFFNLSVPEPVGVVGVIAPRTPALLGLVSVLAPVLVSGSTAVVIASESHPLPAITLAEVLATSDVPAGVVNVLTGYAVELAPVLAGHLDIDGLDLAGLVGTDTTELEIAAAENVKRVLAAPATAHDWRTPPPGVRRIVTWTDTKTVWHPKGP